MNVIFVPIPPETYSSLRQTLINKAEEMGLSQHFTSTSAFASVVEANLDYDDPEVKAFIEWAKQKCQVQANL